MFRFKPFSSFIYPRIYYNSNKLYSKAHEKMERAGLRLPDSLESQMATTTPNTDSSLTTKDESLEVSKISGNESKQVARNADYKSKNGKKHDHPKTMQPYDPGPPGGCNMNECDLYDIPKANPKKWRAISYAVLPLVLGLSLFILTAKEEHPEPEFIPYEHLYRHTKRFPWRDGKTSLFHGRNNLIPEEEEKRLDREKVNQKKGELRYKKHVDEEEEKIKRREQHVLEEQERRKERHEEEQSKSQ